MFASVEGRVGVLVCFVVAAGGGCVYWCGCMIGVSWVDGYDVV